jgi:hypothetical protein
MVFEIRDVANATSRQEVFVSIFRSGPDSESGWRALTWQQS